MLRFKQYLLEGSRGQRRLLRKIKSQKVSPEQIAQDVDADFYRDEVRGVLRGIRQYVEDPKPRTSMGEVLGKGGATAFRRNYAPQYNDPFTSKPLSSILNRKPPKPSESQHIDSPPTLLQRMQQLDDISQELKIQGQSIQDKNLKIQKAVQRSENKGERTAPQIISQGREEKQRQIKQAIYDRFVGRTWNPETGQPMTTDQVGPGGRTIRYSPDNPPPESVVGEVALRRYNIARRASQYRQQQQTPQYTGGNRPPADPNKGSRSPGGIINRVLAMVDKDAANKAFNTVKQVTDEKRADAERLKDLWGREETLATRRHIQKYGMWNVNPDETLEPGHPQHPLDPTKAANREKWKQFFNS